ADVNVGNEIYGTQRRGNYRRYVTTPVLAYWSTVKRAYRIRLEDDTELIASGDHRFLSNRGWKYVIGAYGGPLQRPHLTTRNHLVGTGRIAYAPAHDDDYRVDYLCGMIRGDGHIGHYSYARLNKSVNDQQQFSLAAVYMESTT